EPRRHDPRRARRADGKRWARPPARSRGCGRDKAVAGTGELNGPGRLAKGRSQPPGGNGPPHLASAAKTALDDRDRIIDAALACIARQGWRRLSLADIASEAGLPILSVYRR